MTKLTLQDLASLTNETSALNTLNANSATIETAFDNTLSRDGTTPNHMLADLDMNSNQILNLGSPLDLNGGSIIGLADAVNQQDAVTLHQLLSVIATGSVISPPDATYVTLSTNPLLSNERVLTAGSNIILTDGGANSTLTAAVNDNPSFTTVTTTGSANIGDDITVAGGARVGFTGIPTDDMVQVGDANFNLDYNTATVPLLRFDAGDFFGMNRSSNAFTWQIGSSDVAYLLSGVFRPANNDGVALGTNTQSFADLFLANGGVINWNNGEATITHGGSNVLNTNSELNFNNGTNDSPGVSFLESGGTNWHIDNVSGTFRIFEGSTERHQFTTSQYRPATNDGIALGTGTQSFSDLFLATGAVINFANGNDTLTHSSGTLTHSGALVNSGDTNLDGLIAFRGDISPTSFGTDQNDYNPTGLSTASTLRLNPTASVNLTGLAGGSDGRILILHNINASQSLTLKDESASSTAANRFALPADVTMSPDSVAVLQYDSTSSRWRCVSGGGGGGGGGAPTTAQYVTLALDGTLSAERVLAVGTGLTLTDGGANGNVTIASAAGAVLQVLQNTYTTNTSLGANPIPKDDTTPQSTEGTQILSQAITPSSSSNKVLVRCSLWGDEIDGVWIASMFRGSTCINAICWGAGFDANTATDQPGAATFEFLDSPATTSATTYSIRCSGNGRLNGNNAGRFFGGTAACTLILEEVKG